jgi:hypothetical protein
MAAVRRGQAFLDGLASAQQGQPAPGKAKDQLDAGGASADEYARDVGLIRASDVKIEPVDWLWPGWLAAGKFHVFGGAPGTGKTTIAMALAATVTTGGRWPDGSKATAGNVVVWSGEDDPADTLVPRLIASGADLARVHFIGDVREGSERRSFDPASDIGPLRRKLADIGGARLLIVDPVVSAIAGDSHKNAEVRRGLQPLADLAASLHCALLGITHFTKGTSGRDPVERITGSLAFGALARLVLVAAKHKEDGEDGQTRRIFCRAKSNIGPDAGGFEYDLQQSELRTHPGIFVSSALWGEPVEGNARELLAEADASGDDGNVQGALEDTKRWLFNLLSAGGAVTSKAIRDKSLTDNVSWRTIERAKKSLGVKSKPASFGGGWIWFLPSDKADDTASVRHTTPSPPHKIIGEEWEILADTGGVPAKNGGDRLPPQASTSGWIEVEI